MGYNITNVVTFFEIYKYKHLMMCKLVPIVLNFTPKECDTFGYIINNE